MDRVVRLFYGGTVNENGEMQKMAQQVCSFSVSPLLSDIVGKARKSFGVGGGMMLRGRFDAGGGGRAHYVLLDLNSEEDWKLYKECLKDAQVKIAEVIVDSEPSPVDVRAPDAGVAPTLVDEPIEVLTQVEPIEVLTQVEAVDVLTQLNRALQIEALHGGESACYDLARVRNDFDDNTFEEEERQEMDGADIDEESDEEDEGGEENEGERGGEENEDGSGEAGDGVHDNVDGVHGHDGGQTSGQQGRGDNGDGVPGACNATDGNNSRQSTMQHGGGGGDFVGERYRSMASADYEVNWNAIFSAEELRSFELLNLKLPKAPQEIDISQTEHAVSGSTIELMEGDRDPAVKLIRNGMVFENLKELQQFFEDYAVRHHRPYYVSQSNQAERYTLKCKNHMCAWGVWARKILHDDVGRWKVRRVSQPHTCGSAALLQEHSQCTARYLGYRIAPMVWADSDISIAALQKHIVGMTNYQVKYGKAWRAKQSAMAYLWGDWKESYNTAPKVLHGIAHFNPGTKVIIDNVGRYESGNEMMNPVLYRMFWCFPQCVEAFKNCRPVVSVDGTFLTGKYRGTLMVAVGQDGEDQLVPLAFAITEGENNQSWSWFLRLVRAYVVGSDRQICLISDRHQGILNAAREEIVGLPNVVHRWCMRHFAANIWKRQKNKDVIKALKALCMAREERHFDKRLEELYKLLNNNAKAWLKQQLPEKSKWALAFDGGWRYGTMTTNISEVFNYVLKGVRALPISALVHFTFIKCTRYFVDRWMQAQAAINAGQIWGEPANEHLEKHEKWAIDQAALLCDPREHVYEVTSSSHTSVGGERSGGRAYKVEIGDNLSCTCMTPQLYHLPCSHVITACRARGVLYKTPNYLSPFYSKQSVLKTWESKFEPCLDPSQWPPYDGPHYVPAAGLLKVGRGRRKKKRFRNELDDSQKGYGADQYALDFTELPRKKRCSLCGEEGHTIARHKEGPRNKPQRRARRASRSRNSGRAASIGTSSSQVNLYII